MSDALNRRPGAGKMPDEISFLSTLLGELRAAERVSDANGKHNSNLGSAVRMVVRRREDLRGQK